MLKNTVTNDPKVKKIFSALLVAFKDFFVTIGIFILSTLVAFVVYDESWTDAIINVGTALFNKYLVIIYLAVFVLIAFYMVGIYLWDSKMGSSLNVNKKLEKVLCNINGLFFLYSIGICFDWFQMPLELPSSQINIVLISEAYVFITIGIGVAIHSDISDPDHEELAVAAPLITSVFFLTLLLLLPTFQEYFN